MQKRPLRTAKFTDAEVRALRERDALDLVDVRDEADRFGCTPETIRKVLRGDTFRHVRLGAEGPRPTASIAAAEAALGAEATASEQRMRAAFALNGLEAEIAAAPLVPVKLARVVAAHPWVEELLGPAVNENHTNPLEEAP